jgi:hypothetical protein
MDKEEIKNRLARIALEKFKCELSNISLNVDGSIEFDCKIEEWEMSQEKHIKLSKKRRCEVLDVIETWANRSKSKLYDLRWN